MLDVLIKGGRIIDGTGKPAFEGDVGIENGKIVFPAAENSEAKQTIDADGYIVCPGFIDAHSHGDCTLGKDFARICKTSQGITTEVCGQCGMSIMPVAEASLEGLQTSMRVIAGEFPEDMKEWTTFERYLKWAEAQPKTANFLQLVGHSTLRIAVMGFANRKARPEELEQMKALLREAMEHGAAGLSTGLIYTPSCYASTEEVVELAKVIAPYGGIYASHMRNEAGESLEAVKEVLEIGKKAGVAVWISHHKILGRKNWGLQKETLRLIDEAVRNGQKVTCDQYPYTCNMTVLMACMPPWYADGGVDILIEQLKDNEFRQKVRQEMENPDTPYDNYYLNAGGWDGVIVTAAPATPEIEGKSVAQYARELSVDPFDAFFDVFTANRGGSAAVFQSMCEEDVLEIAQAPNTVVGTDGMTRALKEKGHPRAFGTFPHAICYYVKQKHIMTLEEMIRRMTSMPAERLHLKSKGMIADGYDADILVIDYEKFEDKASYVDSNALTEGLEYVIVNGEIVMRDKVLTGAASGRFVAFNN